MRISEITDWLDRQIPLGLQADYDNSGLQTGDIGEEASAALLCIDVTEKVVDEAYARGCNLIISHHPVIFNPLKKVTGNTEAERVIIKAVRNNITIYSAHTNLDSLRDGVSSRMAMKLGLKNVEVLEPVRGRLVKLVAFVPHSHLKLVRDALFQAGAGHIGNYDSCGFSGDGTGTFRGNENSNPFAGEKGSLHAEPEVRFETIMPSFLISTVIKALIETHPYEEPAFDIYPLLNEWKTAGMGCVGTLEKEINESDFLSLCKSTFSPCCLRHTAFRGKEIRKVALCGGAGVSLLEKAIDAKADAFVTGDVKYHQFAAAAADILLVDAGHFETEKFATEIFHELLTKKFPNFALRFSETISNPINCY